MPSVDRLIVRPAVLSDVDVLVKFNAALALETEGRRLDLERLRQGALAVFEAPARGRYLIAEVPSEPVSVVVGQLLVTFEWSDWRNATFWWLQSVYVDPAWRRRGVFRRMHEAILGMARAQGDVCGIRLYVEESNTVAQAVYSRLRLCPTTYRVFEVDFVLKRSEHAE
jgi:GNAT superfamily N-acetyltransferase